MHEPYSSHGLLHTRPLTAVAPVVRKDDSPCARDHLELMFLHTHATSSYMAMHENIGNVSFILHACSDVWSYYMFGTTYMSNLIFVITFHLHGNSRRSLFVIKDIDVTLTQLILSR